MFGNNKPEGGRNGSHHSPTPRSLLSSLVQSGARLQQIQAPLKRAADGGGSNRRRRQNRGVPRLRRPRLPHPQLRRAVSDNATESSTEQETHDLYCPNCKSCITRRVILRKRKRTVRQALRDEPPKKPQTEESSADASNQMAAERHDQEAPEVFRCLSCFTFFIPTGEGQ